MRTIKFRAWVKSMVTEETGMYYPSVIKMDSVGNVMVFYTDEKGGFKFKDDTCKFELMQFTGLKDKNGKEIYEGDIMEQKILDDSKHTENSRFLVKYLQEIGSYNFYDNTFGEFREDEYIVIGNIYENKGLLNGNK